MHSPFGLAFPRLPYLNLRSQQNSEGIRCYLNSLAQITRPTAAEQVVVFQSEIGANDHWQKMVQGVDTFEWPPQFAEQTIHTERRTHPEPRDSNFPGRHNHADRAAGNGQPPDR